MRFRKPDATLTVFLAIIALVVLWIGSGMLVREPPQPPQRPDPGVPVVAASHSTAKPVTRELVLYRDVEPVQIATLRARTDGLVESVVPLGTRVERGQPLVQLSADDREARLAYARAQVDAAQRDYEAARQLLQRGAGTQSDVRARLAQLEAARAELRTVELDLTNTQLPSPITGTVSRIIADVGAYVTPGGEILEVVDNDPLVAVVNVQQSAVGRVRPDMPAVARFIGGEQRDGVVRFVSPIADAATRTFRVEIHIDNSDGQMPAGLSAEVVIPVETVPAHRISAALVQLDAQGNIGVYSVDDSDRIAFLPINVVRARADGIWVTGLPEQIRIVTISQGSLGPGQQVRVQDTPPEYLQQLSGAPARDQVPTQVVPPAAAGAD